jgi:hypothetical protein
MSAEGEPGVDDPDRYYRSSTGVQLDSIAAMKRTPARSVRRVLSLC